MVIVVGAGSPQSYLLRVVLAPEFAWFGLHHRSSVSSQVKTDISGSEPAANSWSNRDISSHFRSPNPTSSVSSSHQNLRGSACTGQGCHTLVSTPLQAVSSQVKTDISGSEPAANSWSNRDISSHFRRGPARPGTRWRVPGWPSSEVGRDVPVRPAVCRGL
jgi:hypothetical protein